MRAALVGSILCFASVSFAASPSPQWQRAVELYQYLKSDYPAAVKTKSPTELAEQRDFAQEALKTVASLGPSGAAFTARAKALSGLIAAQAAPAEVASRCASLIQDLVRAGGLARSPLRAPDLSHGKALFTASCAACHGADGRANTKVAKKLDPPPASFHSPEVMEGLTPFKAFNVMRFGVSGTSMPAFSTLSDSDRWALAFYLFTLRQPACDSAAPAASLDDLATKTDAQLGALYGAGSVACLRARLPRPDEEKSLLIARDGVRKALKLAASGHASAARSALVYAYLDGIEPVEPLLRSRDPSLVSSLESAFLRARVEAQSRSAHLAAEGQAILSLIDRARESHGGAGGTAAFLSVFWLAALVIVREGFEAMVVVAALFAVLKKMDVPKQVRAVHIGWSTALLAGALTFVVGHHLLGGANRELLEGVTALVAVVMLLYAALWLNARSNIRAYMGELRQKMQGAMGKHGGLLVFFIAFTAVYRECFEAALFLQGLSVDSTAGAIWGAVLGLGLMVGFVLMVRKVGYKLPMKPLFTASTWLLFATAVILLGEGVHSLQEVGTLPLWPFGDWSLPALGIYADLYSLVPQLLLSLCPLPFWMWKRKGARASSQNGPRGGLATPP